MRNTKIISEKSFNTIKDVASKLKKEVAYEKAHGIDPYETTDFVDYKAVDGVQLAYELDNDGTDATIAANLEFTNTDRGILISYADEDDIDDDGGLSVKELSDIMNKVVGLGRKGITARENKISILGKRVRTLESAMDLA